MVFLVFLILNILWFFILSDIIYDLNVFVRLCKIGIRKPVSAKDMARNPRVSLLFPDTPCLGQVP